MDSVAVAKEVVSHLMERHNKGLPVKVDFKKAFNTLDWGFPLSSLAARGFGEIFQGWIKECLSSLRAALLNNAETKPSGLRGV